MLIVEMLIKFFLGFVALVAAAMLGITIILVVHGLIARRKKR